jgi:hypothetical protein
MGMRLPAAAAGGAVLDVVENELMNPKVVERALVLAEAEILRDGTARRREALAVELSDPRLKLPRATLTPTDETGIEHWLKESSTRLALKAQGQCRATLETLAVIKNPTMVFARQANIAHGPQQVNNGPVQLRALREEARARENAQFAPNELLVAHGKRLDLGATRPTSAGDPALAAVDAIDRPTDG